MPTPFLILLLTVAIYASVWNGKTDTAWHNESETEFTITTAEQLTGFAELVNSGNNFEGKTVKLGTNIMLNDTTNWQNWASSPPANEWVPIGREKSSLLGILIVAGPFNGIFDGNGFTVSGVYINSEKKYQGFFGYVGSGGAIKKIGVVASYIKGDYRTGGLVGYNHYGTISDSHFSGEVMGTDEIGGLIGSNFGTVNNSHSSGKVVGSLRVGGLVGYNSGTITNSHYSGDVIGESRKIGGLVGFNLGNIVSSYSTGNVTGKWEVGGLVGQNGGYSPEGTIINSYSSSNITGRYYVGGLVGNNIYLIVNSYFIGKVIGNIDVGGLVGDNSGMISSGYYDKQAIKQSQGTDIGIGKTTAEMQSKAFVDSLNFIAGFLSANAWVYSPGKYPVLSEQIASWPDISRFFASGNGTEANPYVISTKKHLENLAYFTNLGATFLGKHFKLSQNIKVNTGRIFAGKWTPIGGKPSFQGTFDGNGFAVSGVSGEGGLFRTLGASGIIKNLGVTDVDIKIDDRAGGLVYYSEGTIINCYSTGRVAAKYNIAGGLVGCNCGDSSRIINSYSTASVSGQNYIGGLVGVNKGFISGSYSTGKVNGTAFYLTQAIGNLLALALPEPPNTDAGGLVGDNEGTIINSHSSSDVTGIESVGGIVGNNKGTISGSYFTGKVKGEEYVGELVGKGNKAVDSYYGSEKK